jgi:hypothetical protein
VEMASTGKRGKRKPKFPCRKIPHMYTGHRGADAHFHGSIIFLQAACFAVSDQDRFGLKP